jgi:hypothetical protein
MTRSRGQIASAYAPLRHFSFENGLGICVTQPVPGTIAHLTPQTSEQILLRLSESTETWFRMASRVAAPPLDGTDRNPRLQFCIDRDLFNSVTQSFEFRADQFAFIVPDVMGYEPDPTTLYCGTCGLLLPSRSFQDMGRYLESASTECPDPRKPKERRAADCAWSQFEVIFVHPSGNWRSVGTDITDYDQARGQVYSRVNSCLNCGGGLFRVDTTAIDLSGWFLKCAKCGEKSSNQWNDNDAEMLRAYGPFFNQGVSHSEPRMQKINYSAAAAYNVHGETFIDFPENRILACLGLSTSAREEFQHQVAERCGYSAGRPDYDEALRQVRDTGNLDLIERFEDALESYREAVQINAPERLQSRTRAGLERLIDDLIQQKIVAVDHTLPPAMAGKFQERRQLWFSRYDPFRLLVEHLALAETKLSGRLEGNRRGFVPFLEPDDWIRPWRDDVERETILGKTRGLLKQLGIADAGLIPRFDLCRFTYGYSRMSSHAWINRMNRVEPVRLCLFPKVRAGDDSLHPVYVLSQKNEAFYIRLDEQIVREWLAGVDCADKEYLDSEPTLAGALLMSAEARDRFLTQHDQPRPPSLYDAVYGLLHSYSHHAMQGVAAYSGLDVGSLGEYVFPADLAFVVYRNGMTMDLGNLSALWRNNWLPFLEYLAGYTRTLGCNIGALCTRQGGACPDCLMIPDPSCVAANRYLSRSLLVGNGHPEYMTGVERIPGFLVVAAQASWGTISPVGN